MQKSCHYIYSSFYFIHTRSNKQNIINVMDKHNFLLERKIIKFSAI